MSRERQNKNEKTDIIDACKEKYKIQMKERHYRSV